AKLRRAMTGLMHDQAASVVRERDRRRLRAMAGVLCLGGLLVGGVLGYVWLHVQRVRVSYELEDLRSLRADVEEQNKKRRPGLSPPPPPGPRGRGRPPPRPPRAGARPGAARPRVPDRGVAG